MTTEDKAMATALNVAIYRWDMYMSHGSVIDLVMAATAMSEYESLGGTEYRSASCGITASLAAITREPIATARQS